MTQGQIQIGERLLEFLARRGQAYLDLSVVQHGEELHNSFENSVHRIGG